MAQPAIPGCRKLLKQSVLQVVDDERPADEAKRLRIEADHLTALSEHCYGASGGTSLQTGLPFLVITNE